MKAILPFLLLLCSCSPLKQVQRNEKKDSVVVDKTVTELVRNEVQKQIGSLAQTVVEFYPPQELPTIGIPEINIICDSASPEVAIPIKRIIHTEINTKSDRSSVTDSIVHQDIETSVNTNIAEQVVEKHPAAVSWIRWVAIALCAIVLILIIIKLW